MITYLSVHQKVVTNYPMRFVYFHRGTDKNGDVTYVNARPGFTETIAKKSDEHYHPQEREKK